MKTFNLLLAVLVTLRILATSGAAATYHVDQRHPGASDANPGTKERPWLTLGRAGAAARAGDTVIIRPGVYREPLIPRHSGEPGKPIIFQGEPLATRSPDEHAIVKGSEVIDRFEREGDGLWVRRPWRGPLYFTDEMQEISVARFRDSARQEQVFVNDEPVERVPAREHLSPGRFFWSREELVIHPPEGVDDLNAALVEVPNRNKVVGAWPSSDPRGSGIWFDIDCRSNRFEHNVAVGNWNVNAGYFYEISFDGVIRNNVSFGQYGAMAGSYGAGVVSSECDGVVIEDNILIAGEGGISILGGRRERWQARNNLARHNLILNSRRYALHIRSSNDDPAASPEANNRFIDNLVLHRATGAPYLIGDRRPNTLEEMERDFPTSTGNVELSDWRALDGARRARVDEALGRIVQALFPPEFPRPAAPRVSLRDIAYLDENRRSVGYLLETPDGAAWLFDVFAPGTWALDCSGSTEPGTIRVWSGLRQRWRVASMAGGRIRLELPEGVHYVTGVPGEARPVDLSGIPTWFPKAPALPPARGEVIRVATADELLAAVDRIGPGATILLADGHYRLPRTVVLAGKRNIAVRGASGDPDKVTLSGRGWESQARNDDLLHIARCEGVTIADLTFADSRSYGIKVEAENGPKDVHIYNCRFRDIGVRAIKGSAGQDPAVRAVNGSVRFCVFENTKVPPADWLFGGDYIAAIDMMALEDWTFSDNVFRNNFITGGPDCGIELWHAEGIQVFNNSIWRPERNWHRGIRVGTGTARTEIVNNLVHGEIRLEGGEARLSRNLARRLEGYFIAPQTGNLALTATATKAIDQGASLPEVTEDIGRRKRGTQPDIGAWELVSGSD